MFVLTILNYFGDEIKYKKKLNEWQFPATVWYFNKIAAQGQAVISRALAISMTTTVFCLLHLTLPQPSILASSFSHLSSGSTLLGRHLWATDRTTGFSTRSHRIPASLCCCTHLWHSSCLCSLVSLTRQRASQGQGSHVLHHLFPWASNFEFCL